MAVRWQDPPQEVSKEPQGGSNGRQEFEQGPLGAREKGNCGGMWVGPPCAPRVSALPHPALNRRLGSHCPSLHPTTTLQATGCRLVDHCLIAGNPSKVHHWKSFIQKIHYWNSFIQSSSLLYGNTWPLQVSCHGGEMFLDNFFYLTLFYRQALQRLHNSIMNCRLGET